LATSQEIHGFFDRNIDSKNAAASENAKSELTVFLFQGQAPALRNL